MSEFNNNKGARESTEGLIPYTEVSLSPFAAMSGGYGHPESRVLHMTPEEYRQRLENDAQDSRDMRNAAIFTFVAGAMLMVTLHFSGCDKQPDEVKPAHNTRTEQLQHAVGYQ